MVGARQPSHPTKSADRTVVSSAASANDVAKPTSNPGNNSTKQQNGFRNRRFCICKAREPLMRINDDDQK